MELQNKSINTANCIPIRAWMSSWVKSPWSSLYSQSKMSNVLDNILQISCLSTRIITKRFFFTIFQRDAECGASFNVRLKRFLNIFHLKLFTSNLRSTFSGCTEIWKHPETCYWSSTWLGGWPWGSNCCSSFCDVPKQQNPSVTFDGCVADSFHTLQFLNSALSWRHQQSLSKHGPCSSSSFCVKGRSNRTWRFQYYAGGKVANKWHWRDV